MSNINYTIDDLQHMVNLGVRGNMVCDNIYKQMMPDVVDRYFDNLVTKGNPVDNKFYKHMKINDAKNHINIASNSINKNEDWKTDYLEDWDIIIDDGSHINSHQIETFKILFPKLKIGGYYFIEDVQTSYYLSDGGDGFYLNNKKTAINFFKTMIDRMHQVEH